MDASAHAALRTALSHSRDGVIAELQDEIAFSFEMEWARLARIHFDHVRCEFGRPSDANAPRRFAERMFRPFIQILGQARWGFSEPIDINGHPHAAGRFNFREYALTSIEYLIRNELMHTLLFDNLIDCEMAEFMHRIEIAASIPPGCIRRLPQGVGLRPLPSGWLSR